MENAYSHAHSFFFFDLEFRGEGVPVNSGKQAICSIFPGNQDKVIKCSNHCFQVYIFTEIWTS